MLGELVEETRFLPAIPVPGNDDSKRTFTTRFTYDPFNRLSQIAYPDGEAVTYGYDSGGALSNVKGLKQGRPRTYIARQEYDKFGQKVFLRLGNGIESTYAYDDNSRRLASMATSQPSSAPFQKLLYSYDGVGNILRLENQVAAPDNDFGGPSVHTYHYDSIYRLTAAEGAFTGDLHGLRSTEYALTMDYDSLNNILKKNQTNRINGKVDKATSYVLTYQYRGLPHAATSVGSRNFTYDADGNQTLYDGRDDFGTNSNVRRSHAWNEEDQLVSVSGEGNGGATNFVYDYAGVRVLKTSNSHTTAYVNAYWTVDSRTKGTQFSKHIFAGGMRIASNAFAAPQDAGNTPNQDGFLFYYHGDHLGSTQFISDRNGLLRQHVEYFPYGEAWIAQNKDNADSVKDLPYLFTGKEQDSETGLTYVGARYYDARTCVWQSADPLLSALSGYPTASAGLTLGAYTYTSGRPTMYTDPSGLYEGEFPYYNPLRWPGALLQLGAEAVGALNIPLISHIARTLVSVGKLAESPGMLVEAGATLNLSLLASAGETAARGVAGIVGLERILPFFEKWVDSDDPGFERVTGGIPVPRPFGQAIMKAWGKYLASSGEIKARDQSRGMKYWHTLSNATFGATAGITEIPWFFLGGLIHEIDPIGVYAEISVQGPLWLLDTPGDIIANCFGTLAGIFLPESAHMKYAEIIQLIVPGPNDDWLKK